jgi:hypothetical protein
MGDKLTRWPEGFDPDVAKVRVAGSNLVVRSK